jgi:hypothetical protein
MTMRAGGYLTVAALATMPAWPPAEERVATMTGGRP